MKKLLLVVMALALMGGICYADCGSCDSSCGSGATGLVGKIVKVTVADPVKGITSGSVEVVDQAGQATVVTVNESAKIVDGTMKALTLQDLKADDSVAVTTTTDASGNAVASEISKK